MRKDAANAVVWVKSVSEIITSGKKISLSEARTKLDAGNRLKFTCSEYRDLRKAYQTAKAWSKRVKKSGLDEGSAHIYKIKELINEHDSFLISMPEEIEALNQALCAYCICRRPYEGFMIGCDDCEEWYHGPCIGVSQAQGNKIDKYLCVRCCVKKVYKHSCFSIAAVVRKWCDPKERSKSRSQDSQKHLRKIREKKREIVKWKDELQANVLKQRELKAQETKLSNPSPDMPQAHTSTPNGNTSLSPQIMEVNGNIAKATASLEQCNRRLEELAELGKKRLATQQKEDSLEYIFQYWCIMLKTKVLVPNTSELSDKSRPTPSIACRTGDQLLSGPMREVMEAASKYGIKEFPDILGVKNSLECICWCHFAFSVLQRKPRVEEVTALIHLSSIVKLPEVKSIGMMRSMISRTNPWQAKVNKALMPVSGETAPFDASILNELRAGLNVIPLTTPQETILLHAIEDGGKRHCVCGGPRDVTKMECCNHCGLWYHKVCFSISDNSENGSKCPFCQKPATTKLKSIGKSTTTHDFSPHAPDPMKVWPPFGFAGSTEALKVLGSLAITLQLEKMQEPKLPTLKQIIYRDNSGRIDNLPIQASSSTITSNNGNFQQPSSVSKKTAIENSISIQSKIPPKSVNNPNRSLSSGTFKAAAMEVNPPILDGNSLLNAREVAESAVKAALSVDVSTSVLGMNSVLNVKDAAEVAVNAASMFKVVPIQPISSTQTIQSESNRSMITNPTYGIVSNGPPHAFAAVENKPIQQVINEGTCNNASGLSFPANQQSIPSTAPRKSPTSKGNQAQNDIINTTSMNNHHINHDAKFMGSNISVTGKHSDKMSHLTPQAVVQTAPVKSAPKPSVLLKKFG